MGLGGNIEMWWPLEHALHERGFQTIAYDASGTGESPPRLVPVRPHGLARQAAHLLDELGVPSAHVLGVSFGGGVAQELALHNPHRVRRLVLASTMCGLGGGPGSPAALALLPDAVALLLAALPAGDFALDVRAGRRRGQPGHAPAPAGPSFPAADPVGIRRPALRGRRMDEPSAAASHHAADARRHGRADPIVPPVNGRILGARIPDATVRVVPDAGHLLMDHADECADLITGFLRGDETET